MYCGRRWGYIVKTVKYRKENPLIKTSKVRRASVSQWRLYMYWEQVYTCIKIFLLSENFAKILAILVGGAKILAILVGGAWVYFNSFRGRTFIPRLEIEVPGRLLS